MESAYEPPSKVEKTLAFSQAAIDEFIRLGGCTKGSTERIYGYYRRANDTAENVLFLRHEYETDHVGIIIDGRKMSASWDDDGVRIAEGDKVEGAWKSIILTWEEVDKRTRELIELGQYIPKHEAERADATYEDMVANMIAFLYRDYFRDLPDDDKTISRFGWPEITEFYKDILHDPQKLEPFCEELDRNIRRMEEKNYKYFSYNNPHFISMLTRQFLRDPIEFKEANEYLMPQKFFITQDRISGALAGTHPVSEGKFRVYSFFLMNKDNAKRAEFLKNEYGIGGSYGGRVDMAYDSKGLAIGYGNLFVNEKIMLSWTDVAKRIDALIKQDKYLSEKEQTLLDWYERSQVARAIQGFYMNRDEEVPRPFTHDAKAVYEDKTKEIIPQIEDSERFAEIYAVMREIFESDLPNTRNYDHHKSCFETVKQYADGTYNLFPNSHFRKKAKPKAEEAGEVTVREETTEEEPAAEIVDIDLSQSGYDIQLGSWIHIGTGEAMLQSVTDKGVELYDGTMFPLEMPYEVFLERLRENPLNDH